ncbi:MAG: serine/threonine protein kinase [Gemmataceae bacterium]|nr:serine/threonine protein kinase [Gemmataceae bacterium]
MPPAVKHDSLTFALEEEKLAHALISRQFITRDEWEQVRAKESGRGFGAMLSALVKHGFLTASQAQRVAVELPTLTTQTIPGYDRLQKIGEGSMGTVFKARQISMDRTVAIKVLKPKLAANKEFLKRFQQEARLAARFNSNHVIQAIDVGTAGDIHYFVMEYVEGVTIKDELQKGKIYDEPEAIAIVLQIARALQAAHRRNLVHRDIKPANIVITKDGTAKLADLGMARTTDDEAEVKEEEGKTMGTPHYMAPEQIKGRSDIDIRADIYSLGATLFHMVTGRPPFPFATVQEVLRAHLYDELTPPDHINTSLSAGLGEVVEVMMAKRRKKRYPSPDELIEDLECLQRGEPPRYARQNVAAAVESVREPDEEEDEDGTPQNLEEFLAQVVPMKWLLLTIGIAMFSCMGNLFLLLRRP